MHFNFQLKMILTVNDIGRWTEFVLIYAVGEVQLRAIIEYLAKTLFIVYCMCIAVSYSAHIAISLHQVAVENDGYDSNTAALQSSMNKA